MNMIFVLIGRHHINENPSFGNVTSKSRKNLLVCGFKEILENTNQSINNPALRDSSQQSSNWLQSSKWKWSIRQKRNFHVKKNFLLVDGTVFQ